MSFAIVKIYVTALWATLLSMLGIAENFRAPDLVAHYTSGGHALALDVFRPPTQYRATPAPTILFLHGGAWQGGGPEQFHRQCSLLSKQGYLCISAAYRVGGRDGTSPADAVTDARAALHHIREHAVELAADPGRIVLAGGSAGGHLAAILATGQDGLAPPEPVAALALFNPMVNLEPGRPDHEYVAAYWRSISPHHQINGRMPPTLIMLGDKDRELPLPTARAFCDKANRLGGDCRLDIAAGQPHAFFNFSYSRWHFHRTLHTMLDFLEGLNLSP